MNAMHSMLNKIFEEVQIPKNKKIKILEIGTGYGDGSTKILYDIMNKLDVDFEIISYEGIEECFISAEDIWKNTTNVEIRNKFFCNKDDIRNFVFPNIQSEDGPLTKEHYYEKYKKTLLMENFEESIDFVPDVVIIDSWRFCHVAILKKLKEFCDNNTIIIMEDDFGYYGEQEIIEKYFELKNLKRYDRMDSEVWNFIKFTL